MANYNQFALFAAKRPSIGNLIMNCTISEVHGGEYVISDAPIENGSTISDHIIKLPTTLKLVGIFSPFPDNGDAEVRNAIAGNPEAKATWAQIRALADSRVPFDVYTYLELYKNMAFALFSHTEDDTQNGGIIRLEATLRQLEFAATINELNIADSVLNNLSSADDVGLQGTTVL
jgi:hypothetical protein